jgi:2-iminobutanoate/2-iminopropanoate deaminase
MADLIAIAPADVAAPEGGYVHGLRIPAGREPVFISGQIPTLADGTVPRDFDAQCRAVWRNIAATLSAAGLAVTDLVKVTTFLTSREFAVRNSEIRREVLGSHQPALTVIVAQTLDPVWLLEIEAIAASRSPQDG